MRGGPGCGSQSLCGVHDPCGRSRDPTRLDPRALLLSNLFHIMYPLLGVTVCLLGAYRQSPAIVALIRVRFAGRSGW
jgi:hypothetical protein